jgi:F0F1-type ATP synthase membrane subunit c/vacuolar-type H+-ATPase subunit K
MKPIARVGTSSCACRSVPLGSTVASSASAATESPRLGTMLVTTLAIVALITILALFCTSCC